MPLSWQFTFSCLHQWTYSFILQNSREALPFWCNRWHIPFLCVFLKCSPTAMSIFSLFFIVLALTLASYLSTIFLGWWSRGGNMQSSVTKRNLFYHFRQLTSFLCLIFSSIKWSNHAQSCHEDGTGHYVQIAKISDQANGKYQIRICRYSLLVLAISVPSTKSICLEILVLFNCRSRT